MENIINPIRFYKPKDPYYYEIDNLPLEDLLENDARLLQAATSILLQLSESGEYASKNWVNTTAHEFSRRIRDFSDVSNSADTTLASKGYFLKTTPINPGDPDGPVQWNAAPPLFEHFSDFTGATSNDVLGYDDVLKVWKPFILTLKLADLSDTDISSFFPGSILGFEPDSPNKWEPKGRALVQEGGDGTPIVPSLPAENDILACPDTSDPAWVAQSPESLAGPVFCGNWLAPRYGDLGEVSHNVNSRILPNGLRLSNGHYMVILNGGTFSTLWDHVDSWISDDADLVNGVNWGVGTNGSNDRIRFDFEDWALTSKGNKHITEGAQRNDVYNTNDNGYSTHTKLRRHPDLFRCRFTSDPVHQRRMTITLFITVDIPPGEYIVPRPLWSNSKQWDRFQPGTYNYQLYKGSASFFRLSRTTSWPRDRYTP